MKNKFNIKRIFALTAILLLFTTYNVFAVAPGGQISVTYSCGVNEGSVSASGSNVSGVSVSGNGWCDRGGSITATATVGSSGSASLSIYASDLSNSDTMTEIASGTLLATNSVKIEASNNGGNTGGGSTGGNTGGNTGGGSSNSGSGSSGSNNNSGSGSNTVPDGADLPDEKTEEDVLLITKIELSVNDESKEILGTQDVAKLDYNYIFKLTKNQRDLNMNVTPLDNEVELTYDKNIIIESDSTEKVLKITAKKGDVTQEYTVTIEIPILITTSYVYDGIMYQVEDNGLVDTTMKELGFTREEYKDTEDKPSYFYQKETIKLQLAKMVTEEQAPETQLSTWVLLDEDNKNQRLVDLYVGKDNEILIINPLPEEVVNETIAQIASAPITVPMDELFTNGEKGIVLKTEFSGWAYQDGFVVNGEQEIGKPSYYYISSEGEISKAVIGFDVENTLYKTWAYLATTGLVIVLLGIGGYVGYEINKKNKAKKSI